MLGIYVFSDAHKICCSFCFILALIFERNKGLSFIFERNKGLSADYYMTKKKSNKASKFMSFSFDSLAEM